MPRALLLLLVAASLAAFGGAYRWSTWPVLIGALLMAAASYRTLHFPRSTRLLDLALAGIAAVMALQLVPLPAAVRAVLSPHAERVAATVRLVPFHQPLAPLSLDPTATAHALATFVSAALVFWATRGMLATGGSRRIARGISRIGGVAAIAALVQQSSGTGLIYGLWEPGVVGATPFGPFVNRNHFAGWLILALPITTGYLIAHLRIHVPDFARERHKWRAIVQRGGGMILAAALAMLLAIVASLSRSALVGLVAAAVVGGRLARDRRAFAGSSSALVFTIAAVATLVVLAALDPEQLARRVGSTLQQTGTNRLTIWAETLPMVNDFWLTGVGGGAYGLGMLVYQQTRVAMAHLQAGGWAHFNQAHSHYLHVLAEGGVLLAVPVVVAVLSLLAAVRRGLATHRGEGEWIRIGAIAALAAIAVQSVWETALRIPANALLFAVAAALAVHHRSRPE